MEREELLSQFDELIETYSKHKAYADKAREKAGNFSSSVIEKVIADHQIKASLVADDIQPLIPQLQEELATLNGLIGEAEQSVGDLGVRIEELELRRAIGEITDEQFDEMAADGKGTVDDANSKISGLAEARDSVAAAIGRWTELSGEPVEAQPIAAESAEAEAEPVDAAADDDFDPVVDSILPGFEEEEPEDDGDIDGEDDVAFAVESDGEESVDVLPIGGSGVAAVEVAIDDSEVGEIGVDPSEDGSDMESGEARRAILLSNEGTPDEQIYALTGEVFTVGRGRDNDLQIKNDSKVSRFHCKVYRRGTNYYLEDNKSSNGTMVNGELISERRLFGGEELVIGETFFRFRVM